MSLWTVDVTFSVTVEADTEGNALEAADRKLRAEDARSEPADWLLNDYTLEAWEE